MEKPIKNFVNGAENSQTLQFQRYRVQILTSLSLGHIVLYLKQFLLINESQENEKKSVNYTKVHFKILVMGNILTFYVRMFLICLLFIIFLICPIIYPHIYKSIIVIIPQKL